MSEHAAFLRLAATAIDFQLEPAEGQALTQHLHGCDTCRRTAASLRADASGLRALPRRSPSPHIAVAVARAAGGRAQTRRSPMFMLGLGFLLLVGVVGAAIGGTVIRQALESDGPFVPPRQASPRPGTTEPAWTRIAGIPEFEGAALADVAVAGPGFVATGSVGGAAGEARRAAAWWSTDGSAWTLVPDGPAFAERFPTDVGLPGAGGATALATDGRRIVAVGGVYPAAAGEEFAGAHAEAWRAAAWSSADGREWTRAPGVPSFQGAYLLDVAAGTGGFVAVGPSGPDGSGVWRSADGVDWEPVKTPAFSDATPEQIVWVGSRYVVTGAPRSSFTECGNCFWIGGPLVWTSEDGIAWTPTRGLPEGFAPARLTPGPDKAMALVRAGVLPAGLYESDGLGWDRLGDGPADVTTVMAAAALSSGYLVVGSDSNVQPGAYDIPAVSFSADGKAWQTSTFVPPAGERNRGNQLAAIAALGPTMVVVGNYRTGPDECDACVLKGQVFVSSNLATYPTPSAAPTDTAIVAPSTTPSTAPSTAEPGRTGDRRLGVAWQVVTPENDGTSSTSANAVTARGPGFVAVGHTCRPDPSGGDSQCWGSVQVSTDGLTWESVARQPGLEIGAYYPPSGPGADMIGVAAGADATVAIGYAVDGAMTTAQGGTVLKPAVWASGDGRTWERAADGGVFQGARFSDVVATTTGYVIVGAVYGPDAPQGQPRGAIWTSNDGRVWQRVTDGPIFDIGGYQDTLEDPGSGGPRRVIFAGGTILAVGAVCDDRGLACLTAFWSSPDGSTWDRVTLAEPNVIARDVAATANGFLAVGIASNAGGCGVDLPCTAAVFTSTDGRTWQREQPVAPAGLILPDGFSDAVVVGGRIIATAEELTGGGLAEGVRPERLWWSTDGGLWSPLEGYPVDVNPAYWQPIAAGPARTVIVGDTESRILVSPPK